MTLGEALQIVLGKLKWTTVARRALGPGLPASKYRDTANYFGRVARDEVPSPGLIQLELMAKGLGFPTLSAFFARVERLIANSALINNEGTVKDPLSPLHSPSGIPEAAHGARSLPPDTPEFSETDIIHFFRVFKAARGGSIAGSIPSRKPARKQASSHRPHKSKGG